MEKKTGRKARHYMGVAPHHSGRWRAQIQLTLGVYDTPEEGHAIYLEAERLFRPQALALRRRCGDLRGT